jgi:hypothetical protein
MIIFPRLTTVGETEAVVCKPTGNYCGRLFLAANVNGSIKSTGGCFFLPFAHFEAPGDHLQDKFERKITQIETI